MKLSEKLKALRTQCGYSKAYVARTIGVSTVSYWGYECNDVIPRAEKLIALAKIYDTPLEELVSCVMERND